MGILDWLGSTSGVTGIPGAADGARMAAAGTPMAGNGILGYLNAPVGSDVAGAGLNRLGLIGAALQDLGGGVRNSGHVDQFMQRAQYVDAQQKQKGINKAIQDAYATGDINKVRQVLVDAASNGVDISHITQAMQIGQPKFEQVDPTRDTVSIDPITGQRTIVSRGVPKMTPNQPFNPDGTPNAAFQAYERGKIQSQQAPAWAGLAETRRYHDLEQGGANKAPAGYRYGPDGNLTFIPGGPADPSKGAGKKAPTEDQAKNNQLYTRTKQQLPILFGDGKGNAGTFDALGNGWNQAGAAVSHIGIPFTGVGVPRALVTGTEFQRAEGALKDIAASYLYSVSGATANPGEVANLVSTITPQIGDSEQTRADKKARIIQMVDSIKLRAQPGISTPEAPAPSQPAAATSNGGWTVTRRK